MYRFPGIFLLLLLTAQLQAQVNINTSPPRLYYNTAPGSSSRQHIMVANRSNKPLDLVISVNDWNYDSLGTNHFYDPGTLPASCAGWITVTPGPYITLKPQEETALTVTLKPPAGVDQTTIPVRMAMVFLTQLNPTAGPVATKGAAVKVALQIGTKIYHSFLEKNEPFVEITNFTDLPTDTVKTTNRQNHLQLTVQNKGKGWVEGSIETELFSKSTGKKMKLESIPFYSLPGDNRKVEILLPKQLESGNYTATAVITYGKKEDPAIAELDFYLNK